VNVGPAALRGDRRGMTLVEILVATAIFAIVAVAIGSLYLSTQRAFDYGSAQAHAQRQGTMIQEDLQRRLQRAVDFAVTACGSATATAAVRYSLPDGGLWCLHQDQKAGDTFPQLYVCTLNSGLPLGGGGSACDVGSAQSLTGQAQAMSETAGKLGTQLRVASTTFIPISTMNGSTMAGRALDVRFDLYDGVMYSLNPASYTGMRFGFTTTLRN
jgi:prepilin-type N-terminal cleavage/methylation domain-containing protein